MNKIILLALVFILAGCTQTTNINDFKLLTSDDVEIAVTEYNTETNSAVILVHMLGRDKSDFEQLAKQFQTHGITTLALDLRGHGDSDLELNSFTESDFKNMINDLNAAYNYLIQQQYTNIGIIGASIGANTALNYAAQNQNIKALILLSPGLNYRGVKTEESIKQYDRPLLIMASTEDSYAYQSSNQLSNLAPGDADLLSYTNRGHGTDMLNDKLNDRILQWMINSLNK